MKNGETIKKEGAMKIEDKRFVVGQVYTRDEFIFICECLISDPAVSNEAKIRLRKNVVWAESGTSESTIVWEFNPSANQVVPIRTQGIVDTPVADSKLLM